MLRRLIVAAASVVLSLGSTACEEPRPVPVRVPIAWNTAPTTDEQHLAVMAAARAIAEGSTRTQIGDATVFAERPRAEPAVGTSPDTPKTPLAVADPCAVLATLGVSTPLAKRFLHACVFEYRGVDIDLQYVYNDRALVAVGAPILVVNGHPGYDLRSITETSWYGAILGTPLSPAGPTSSTGPRVPAVKLTGRDPAVLREVLGHTMDLFPAT